jgi:hypothetical protein
MGENAAFKHYPPQGNKVEGTKSTPYYSRTKLLSFVYSITTTQVIVKVNANKKKDGKVYHLRIDLPS